MTSNEEVRQTGFVQKLQEALQQSEHIEQRLKALEPKPLPEFVVEEHRYTNQLVDGEKVPMDGWVFVHLSPSSLEQGGSELPFDQDDPGVVFRYAEHVGPSPVVTVEDVEKLFTDSPAEPDWDALRWYHRMVEGWMHTPEAEEIRERLANDGFTKVDWDTVPAGIFNYVYDSIAPIEWHGDPQLVKDMAVVWLKGEWPA